MAYSGKARKEDLRLLAEELNLKLRDMKIADLSELITTHPDYEEQRVSIEKRHWISALLALMSSEINQLMARESEEKFDDYDYIKGLLLKCFKLSAEIFRQKFVKHQRNPAQSWRDFVFEITSYFEEWLGGLGVNDFEGLKNLMITDQLKRRVPGDVREQFVDIWVKSIVPGDLADLLDEYESVRANVRGAHSNNMRTFGSRMPEKYKTPPRSARSNIITAKGTELAFTKEVVTAGVSIPVSVPINTKNEIDDLRLVDIKCSQTSIIAVIDTGAQISVLRKDLIGKGCGESEGTIQIISAFDEEALVFRSERAQILNVDSDVVAQPVAVEEEKGLSRNSSNVPPISAEDETYESKEKPKLPKRKLKELSRMSVTKLQRKVKLKASSNIVLVPHYWNFKREYLQDKRGIGTLAWELPGFIKRIGVGKVRQSLREREDQETTKVKMRKRVGLKLRTHDISRDFLNVLFFW
ncbi:retrovirus-related Pol polyprotein from transposon opus [Trichonephila inaurata madagascariensis]|uniref:Retrovirus-related Pol polyprotein from transposon opus n=1 Tax=Trichonephila inaurata madagascariensis TaxID=2747483 RepID=A0A8X6MF98_9ARAC|nr:retrovirus-related Pol polyprotein from transposon opus [Trichonephila inaurata madagascariensis]